MVAVVVFHVIVLGMFAAALDRPMEGFFDPEPLEVSLIKDTPSAKPDPVPAPSKAKTPPPQARTSGPQAEPIPAPQTDPLIVPAVPSAEAAGPTIHDPVVGQPPPPSTVVAEADMPEIAAEASKVALKPPVSGLRTVAIFFGDFSERNQIGRGQVTVEYPPEKRYLIAMEAEATGLMSWVFPGKMTASSKGIVGPTGLEPERAIFRSPRSAERATNFDRQSKVVSFSSTDQTQTLVPGVQDRFSMIFQMAMLAGALPDNFKIGEQIDIPFAGIRTTSMMSFKVVRFEPLEVDGKVEQALYIAGDQPSQRDSAKIEIWLQRFEGRYEPLRFRWTETNGRQLDFLMSPPGAG